MNYDDGFYVGIIFALETLAIVGEEAYSRCMQDFSKKQERKIYPEFTTFNINIEKINIWFKHCSYAF